MAEAARKENLIPKRSRIKYKPEQVEVLERAFEDNHYPDTLKQEKLALELGVSLDRISIWFQNRRSKFKRQVQAGHIAWMRKQIFQESTDYRSLFGTPKLPALTSACHVLSPLETQASRNDLATDTISQTPSPQSRCRSFGSQHNATEMKSPSHTHEYNTSYLSTPSRPVCDIIPVTSFQQHFSPFYDIFQSISPTVPSLYIPSMHSVAQSHVTRSRLDHVEMNSCHPPQEQSLTPSFHNDIKRENSSLVDSNSSVKSERKDECSSASSVQTFGWLDSDSDSSPSKDRTLDCLAQWC